MLERLVGLDRRLTMQNIFISDVVPVARLEAFRALKLSILESLRALKFVGQIWRF